MNCKKASIYHGEEMLDCREVKREEHWYDNFWSKLVCVLNSSNYTEGCKWNEFKKICECKGQIRTTNWKR